MPPRLLIPTDYAGLRLDQALARLYPEHSRARLQAWIKDGRVRLDGKVPLAKTKIWGGEEILVSAASAAPVESVAMPMDLDILHEDDAILVLNKPAGLVVHPGHGNASGTLMNALLHHAPSLAALPRAGIVHRLDKDTSGLMVIAKTQTAFTHLVRQLQTRSVTREYLALTHGRAPPTGKIEAPIGRHPTQRVKMAVRTRGKPATTHFKLIQQGTHWSLLRCTLETGRTHQIRVHLARLGYPILGDPTYGNKPLESRLPAPARGFGRQALHATRLALAHPVSAVRLAWECPPPPDFRQLLESLEQRETTS